VIKLPKYIASAEVAVVMTCFAANSIFTRYLVQSSYVPPFTLTVIRFVSGFATLHILTSLMPKAFRRDKVETSHVLAAVFLALYAFSISYGYVFVPVAAGTLIFFAFVVTSMTLYSVIGDGEKVTPRMVMGQLIGLAGVSLITFSGVGSVTPIGVLLMASAGVSWGMYSAYGRRFEYPFSYTYNSFLIFAAASTTLFLVAYPTAGGSMVPSSSAVGLSLALFMGMVSTALGYVLWQRIMKRIRVYQGGVVQLVVPILTSVIGVAVLGEEVTAPLIIGGVLVLSGIFLSTVRSAGRLHA
jgi:drug/metabolite transporter (DMT)-like permease